MIRAAAFASVTLLVLVRASSAGLYLSEGFSDPGYDPGVSIEGLSGGTPQSAFAAVWDDLKNNAAEVDVIQGGLSYTGPVGTPLGGVLGNSVVLRGAAGTTLDTSEDDRNIVDISPPDGASLWLGFLLRKDSGSAVADAGFLKLSIVTGAPDIYIGDTADSGNFGLVRPSGPKLTSFSNVAATPGVTHFLAAKFTFGLGATDKLEVFVDPEPGMLAPATADATLTGLNVPGITRLRLAAAGHVAGSSYSFDELRVGDTFADISGVPEPGCLGLLTSAGLVICARRRRLPTAG